MREAWAVGVILRLYGQRYRGAAVRVYVRVVYTSNVAVAALSLAATTSTFATWADVTLHVHVHAHVYVAIGMQLYVYTCVYTRNGCEPARKPCTYSVCWATIGKCTVGLRPHRWGPRYRSPGTALKRRGACT